MVLAITNISEVCPSDFLKVDIVPSIIQLIGSDEISVDYFVVGFLANLGQLGHNTWQVNLVPYSLNEVFNLMTMAILSWKINYKFTHGFR